METRKDEQILKAVRERYANAATSSEGCCSSDSGGCCGPTRTADDVSLQMGYSEAELAALPEGANLGLGCGNPQAIAALQPGEVVLDLGSGAGIDCFLAAKAVGPEGRVIGVDMTPEMIRKANRNAEAAGTTNVEFRLGQIEALPVDSDAVDVIISNCVINLSPDKQSVYREAFRVLKPGGRLAISDVVTTAELPDAVKNDLGMYAGCVAGALSIDELERILGEAGFAEVNVAVKDGSREVVREWGPSTRLEDCIASATIEAVKP